MGKYSTGQRLNLSKFLFMGIAIAAAIALNGGQPLASQAYPDHDRLLWGQGGRDGRNGRDGRSGRDGIDQTIFVDGRPANLDLSGGDGEDGTDADDGETARCPAYWDEPEYNLLGADGGDGGRGGNAGNGGNGGDLTIFYQRPEDLRQIFVNNFGGQGGIAGRGGYGGNGCDCPDETWQVETCRWEEVPPTTPDGKPHKEQKCTTERFYCTDGRDGRTGSDGSLGRDGSNGSVTLIRNLTTIPTDNPSLTTPLDPLQKTGVTLSKNIWRSQSGLLSQLASGSRVQDTYTEYGELWQVPIKVIWQATQPSLAFADARFYLALQSDRTVTIDQSGDRWLDYRVEPKGKGFNLVVTRAMQASDATQLMRQGFSGTGRDLTFTLTDFGKHHQWLDTTFYVQYRTRNPNPEFREGYTYGDRYNQTLPVEYVTQNGTDYILHLGDLPINAQYLQSGTAIALEITAYRSFAGHQTSQTIQWQGTLP